MIDDFKHRRETAADGLTRRDALRLTLAAGVTATSITLAVTNPAEAARAGAFLHGVASGDPQRDRVIIWTRVTVKDAAEDIRLKWLVAEDAEMRSIVQRGGALARASRDFTVKVDVTGLEPGRTYYYRFEGPGGASPVGRTKTLPEGALENLKLGVLSCSNFELGLFNTYGEAAKIKDLDAVLHLGDYIYEYGPGEYITPANVAGLVPKPREGELRPAREIIELDQYRARHALYRTDANLQALHRQNPFINIWDDHEVANDAWTGGAENHDRETEGPWQARKQAGIRAFYEWLPIRDPERRIDPETRDPASLYRSFDFGDLARLIMLDTRQAARDEQLTTDKLVGVYAGAPPQGPFPNDVSRGAPRTLLGTAQESWLDDQIATSTQTWQLIGNQVLAFYQGAPDINGTTVLTPAEKLQLLGLLDQLFGAGGGQQIAQLGAAGLPSPIAADAWTGYPTARLRMLKALSKARNPVVLTGDSHNAWTANLRIPNAAGSRRVGVEFGGASVSSPGFEQFFLNFPPEKLAALLVDTSARKSGSDKLIYSQMSERGFMVVNVRPTDVRVDYVFLSTVFEETYTTSTTRFRVPVDRKAVTTTTTTS